MLAVLRDVLVEAAERKRSETWVDSLTTVDELRFGGGGVVAIYAFEVRTIKLSR